MLDASLLVEECEGAEIPSVLTDVEIVTLFTADELLVLANCVVLPCGLGLELRFTGTSVVSGCAVVSMSSSPLTFKFTYCLMVPRGKVFISQT